MRRAFLLIGLLGCVAGCDDDDDRWRRSYRHNEHSILFGISQRTDETGKVTTTSGYEFLSLDGKGWSQVRSQEDDECFFEDIGTRLGRARVEGGIARFIGGKLPGGGIALLANQDGPTVDGPGWDTGARLGFNVTGFAVPSVGTYTFVAPPTALALTTPKDEPLTLQAGADFDVAWTPMLGMGTSTVLVSFETDAPTGRGRDVACFFKNASSGKVPGELLRRLASPGENGEVKGTLDIATHAQLTIHAAGGWTIYAIATVLHRQQPFVYRPN